MRRPGWFPLAAAALAFLVTAFLAAPLTAYLFNAGAVATPPGAVVAWAWPAVLCVAALVALVGVAAQSRGREVLAALLLAAAALLYVQGNVLVRDYGKFDGSAIDWSRHRAAGWLEAALWLGVAATAVAARRRVWRWAPAAALVIVAANGLALGGHLLSGRSFAHETATGLDERFARFSREKNVLVVVMDAFASPVFEQVLAEDPAWRERLDGFTWYRDALGAYPTTLPSIPAMLSGRTTDNAQPVRAFLRESLQDASLPVVLRRHGFDTATTTEPIFTEFLGDAPCASTVSFLDAAPGSRRGRDARLVWNVALFRYLPHDLKRRVHDDQRWLLRERASAAGAPPYATDEPFCAPSPNQQAGRLMQQALLQASTAGSDRPTFKFLHFFTTHMPYFLDADGTQLTRERAAAMTEAQAVTRQSACALDQFTAILRRLDELGVGRQTLVILAGDHGSHLSWLPGVDDVAAAAGRPQPTRALPLLLVRMPGAAGPLKVSSAPVCLTDIPATVASVMGVAAAFPGQALHEVPEAGPRPRLYRDYTWTHDFWWEEYLPAMTEYRVEGPARDPASWGAGRALPTGPAAAAAAPPASASR